MSLKQSYAKISRSMVALYMAVPGICVLVREQKPENCNQYNTESSHTSRCQQLNFNTQMHDHSFSLSGPRQVHAVHKLYTCMAIYMLIQHGV